ncbi:TetR/AcrR family transcriptional regulator, partial [Turicibacter sanguinis]|nr:TetR/AcrR family transcriptional regulator [Turicibacter sanguinis]
VSRASFYRNFINKEDILKQHLVKLIQEWGTEFEQSKNPNFVESLFGHYLKYAETYQLLYKCGLSYLVLDTIKSVCGPKPEQENIQAYTNAWLACGLFGWIDEWIIRGMQESPIEMARLVEWSQQSNNSSPIN